MTLQDEARELLADVRRAEDALSAVRREIDEAVADQGGHIDVDAAEEFRRRLEAAQERLREAKKALADVGADRFLRGTDGDSGDLVHWCPGCNMMHVLPWKRGSWTFNGDMTAPTFTPSFLHRWPEWDGHVKVERVCHYILTAGVLNFCSDSRHPLAGQSVPLPELPSGPGV